MVLEMEKNIQEPVMTKPNLFLIGAPKCGTTALAFNLAQHPEIFLPKQKEPRYFDRTVFYDDKNDYITKTLEEYLEYYKEATNEKYLLDASVFNIYSQESIENILALSPNAKFIVILRDPVEASLSMFYQRLSYVDPTMRELCDDFNQCWMMLEERKQGEKYPEGCKNKFLFRYDLLYSYQNYLPYLQKKLDNNLFIGFYDEYKNNPEDFFQKLFTFLDIKQINIENNQINKSEIIQKSSFLTILYKFAKHTKGLRKKLRSFGIVKLQRFILSKFTKDANKKNIKIDSRCYQFFQETYQYMENLKNVENKNSKQ